MTTDSSACPRQAPAYQPGLANPDLERRAAGVFGTEPDAACDFVPMRARITAPVRATSR